MPCGPKKMKKKGSKKKRLATVAAVALFAVLASNASAGIVRHDCVGDDVPSQVLAGVMTEASNIAKAVFFVRHALPFFKTLPEGVPSGDFEGWLDFDYVGLSGTIGDLFTQIGASPKGVTEDFANVFLGLACRRLVL